jgi:hypothetical protein
MDLRAENNSSFHLRIVGYQFPENEQDEWDSNWLRIHMAVVLPQGDWSLTEPFLLTYEVSRIADWFDAIADHAQAANELEFVEPNLRFEVMNLADKATYLRVHFGLECLPPWVGKNEHGTGDVFADFRVSNINLHETAESLRLQLSLYPRRAPC